MKDLEIHWRLKHMGSSLPDLGIRASVDEDRRKVHAVANHFDSVLVAMFFRSLEEGGKSCIEDEHDYRRSPTPPWEVFLTVAGTKFLCRVVLRPKGEIAVYLYPQPA